MRASAARLESDVPPDPDSSDSDDDGGGGEPDAAGAAAEAAAGAAAAEAEPAANSFPGAAVVGRGTFHSGGCGPHFLS